VRRSDGAASIKPTRMQSPHPYCTLSRLLTRNHVSPAPRRSCRNMYSLQYVSDVASVKLLRGLDSRKHPAHLPPVRLCLTTVLFLFCADACSSRPRRLTLSTCAARAYAAGPRTVLGPLISDCSLVRKVRNIADKLGSFAHMHISTFCVFSKLYTIS
jgi:hypothetical protein